MNVLLSMLILFWYLRAAFCFVTFLCYLSFNLDWIKRQATVLGLCSVSNTWKCFWNSVKPKYSNIIIVNSSIYKLFCYFSTCLIIDLSFTTDKNLHHECQKPHLFSQVYLKSCDLLKWQHCCWVIFLAIWTSILPFPKPILPQTFLYTGNAFLFFYVNAV